MADGIYLFSRLAQGWNMGQNPRSVESMGKNRTRASTQPISGIQVLKKVKQMGQSVSRLHTTWVDGGFSGENFLHLVMDVCHWLVQVVLRPKEHQGFVLLPKRWVVERTFGR
jgi:transposase